jgi:hypothetical protein
VHYLHIVPVFREVLDYEAAVTLLRGVLAAEKNCAPLEIGRPELGLDTPFPHQRQEARFILLPWHGVLLLVGVKDFRRGCQEWGVLVAGPNELLEKVGQVIPLRESRKLRTIIEPYI